MNFTNAVKAQKTTTENGMVAFKSSMDANVDLFYKIGASRGNDIIPSFIKAYVENPDLAVKIALWSRDIREGCGERQLFRDILVYLTDNVYEPFVYNVILKVPELGRWDDLFVIKNQNFRNFAFAFIGSELMKKNGLCAKWMPRKGLDSIGLRNFLGMSPKQYRKTLVELTNVVETKMCAKEWDDINFSHVPSLAAIRYSRAFSRNAPKSYSKYILDLKANKTKVNVGAVYPYDVIKPLLINAENVEKDFIIQQWNSLPNYIGDANILPMVDVSGSMNQPTGMNSKLSCMDVAVSLGLYLSDKNQGAFNGTYLTFTDKSELCHLKGDIVQKLVQMRTGDWGMNTDLVKAFNNILKVAIEGNVSKEDMPKMLLILSDMQFDESTKFSESAQEMIERKYCEAGYDVPVIVYWNLCNADNIPVKFDKKGTVLISGFSPIIMKSVLSADMNNINPEVVMLHTVMKDRYEV